MTLIDISYSKTSETREINTPETDFQDTPQKHTPPRFSIMPTLDTLPPELLHHILTITPLSDGTLSALSLTSRALYTLASPLLYTRDTHWMGSPALLFAAQHDRLPTARRALTYTPNLSQATLSFLLSLSASSDSISVLELLLSQPTANPNAGYAFGLNPPLIEASSRNAIRAAKLLLSRPDTDPNARDLETRGTPLHRAALQNHLETVTLLLAHPTTDINARNLVGWTPLHKACLEGHAEIARALLDTGRAHLNQRCATEQCLDVALDSDSSESESDANPDPDPAGPAPLHIAARNNHASIITLPLSHPNSSSSTIDVNARDDEGWTPLHGSVDTGRIEIVHTLLSCPTIDLNLRADGEVDGMTPLAMAARQLDREWDTDASSSQACAYLSIVEALLSHPTTCISWDRQPDRTILESVYWCAAQDVDGDGDEYVSLFKLLRTKGAARNPAAVNGVDMFSYAARRGRADICSVMLDDDVEGQIEVDKPDEQGRTALSRAAEGRYARVVRLLLGTGRVDVNAGDKDGKTAVEWAGMYGWEGSEGVVRLLLSHGADIPDVEDEEGREFLRRLAEG